MNQFDRAEAFLKTARVRKSKKHTKPEPVGQSETNKENVQVGKTTGPESGLDKRQRIFQGVEARKEGPPTLTCQ